MTKNLSHHVLTLFLFFGLTAICSGQVLIDASFNVSQLPEGVTTSGTVSTSGAIGNCTECSPGRVVISPAGYFQVDVPALSVFTIIMKSSASARNVALKFKLASEAEYTTLTTLSVVNTVGGDYIFALAENFPQMVSTQPVSVRLENLSGGEFHIHDLYVEGTAAQSSAAEILAFKIPGQIGEEVIYSSEGTILISIPTGTPLSSITPTSVVLSPEATVSPLANVSQDFTDPVVYTVTAQDNTSKQWTITVQWLDEENIFADYQAEDAEFTGKVDNQHANYTGTGFVDFLSGGENYIRFTVCQEESGNRTLKFRYSIAKDEERTGKLFVNDVFVSDVEFPRTDTFADWADASTTVSLNAGVNSVRLTWDETDGPNLDKLSISGVPCPTYLLTIQATNDGDVSVSPQRANHRYFSGETVTILAEDKANATFENWTGSVTGTTNPVDVTMDGDKTITANFTTVKTFQLTVLTNGIGQVTLDPPGGEYADGTVVTLTAGSILGSVFQGWSGSLTGTNAVETLTIDGNKTVTASFTSDAQLSFDAPVGFASVNTGSTYPEFNGPTIGGREATEILWVNGPEDFDMLAWHLYYRNRAYRNLSNTNGVKREPLVIVFKEGVYPEGTSTSSAWGNHMMTIQEQGDLTILGQGNVVLNWGFNIKRSWNILIRNITFQDYYDDGINIGEPETHHIWIDHCTIGHPTTMPADTEHPDGGIDVKAGASYVTISWCVYRNSWKTGLVGHSDSNGPQDLGKLKVTYYANHFYNTNSRNPRVRFGEVHLLNNLEEQVKLYGVAASNQSQVYAENNFFLNTRWPMYADRSLSDFRAVYGTNTDGVFTSKTGNIACTGLKQIGNEYDDAGLPVITAQINPAMLNPGGQSIRFDEHNVDQVFNPSSYYSYQAFPASVVRTLVPLFAGANKIDFLDDSGNTGSIVLSGSPTQFVQTLGSPSATQTYSLAASALSGDLTVTPPPGFELSGDDGTTWFSTDTPLVISPDNGAIAATVITVRLNASAVGSYGGDITHVAEGATTKTIALSGSAYEDGEEPIPVGNWTAYHADQLPNAFSPAFTTSQQSGTFVNSILPDSQKEGNSLLHMQTSANGDNNQWRQNVTAGLQAITVVIKARSTNADPNLLFDIDLDHGTKRWSMRVLNNGHYQIAVPSSSSTFPLGDIDMQAWNTFRFTKDGENVSVYINESSSPVYTGTAANGTNNYFRFGDGWGSGRIDSHIDWVLWDVTGAFSPADTSLPAELADNDPQPSAVIVLTGSTDNFSQLIGTPSSSQTYEVSGTDLKENIVITPPSGFEVSGDNGNTWFDHASPLAISHQEGTVDATTIHVRLNASEAGSYSGIIAHNSAGVSTVSLSVTGIAEIPPAQIDVSGTLHDFQQQVGTPSIAQQYTISGSNLQGNLTVTPATGFEVSADNGTSWKNSTSPLVIPATGSLPSTTVLVRLNAVVAGEYNGNIKHESPGAEAVSKTVSGSATTVTGAEKNADRLLTLSPNPATSYLTIHHPLLKKDDDVTLLLYVYNATGQRVPVQILETTRFTTTLDVSAYVSGVYYIEYWFKNQVLRSRFIKE